MKKKIVICGTIGSGKSTFANMIRARGYDVFDSDQCAKSMYKKDSVVYEELIQAFGQQILDDQGNIVFSQLAQIVFNDESKRLQLNSIVHPRVKEEMMSWMDRNEHELVFCEVPLVFEVGWQNLFDIVVLITCEQQTAIQRLIDYRGFDEQEARRRIRSQIDVQTQIAMADEVIYNDGTLEDLSHIVDAWLMKVKEETEWNVA